MNAFVFQFKALAKVRFLNRQGDPLYPKLCLHGYKYGIQLDKGKQQDPKVPLLMRGIKLTLTRSLNGRLSLSLSSSELSSESL